MTQIHVDYLCKEPFWKFTKRGHNQFCTACKEEIVDFTQWNEKSVIDQLKQKDGNSCGLFYKDQFIIDNTTQTGPSLKAMILAGGLSSVFSTQSLTQNETIVNEIIEIHKDAYVDHFENVDFIKAENCDSLCIDTKDEPEKEKKYRKRHALYIGMTRIYVNFKFPFLHIHRIRMGKLKVIKCPTFE